MILGMSTPLDRLLKSVRKDTDTPAITDAEAIKLLAGLMSEDDLADLRAELDSLDDTWPDYTGGGR